MVRVAAIQMVCEDGQIARNIERAETLVARAAADGAKIIVLPELMPTGFRMSAEMWDAGEPPEGATVQWLRRISRRLEIWIGTSFLEAKDGDFFNTFVLCGPKGTDLLRVRKQQPASVEAFFFKGADGPHVVETPIGRIGVSICYEQALAAVVRRLHDERADVVLMPHSAPKAEPQPGFPATAAAALIELVAQAPNFIARTLGVPTIMANKAGAWNSPMPGPIPDQHSAFMGRSAIVDADGADKARLGEDEGIAIADIAIDAQRRRPALPPMAGHWSRPAPLFVYLWRIVEVIGAVCYWWSGTRRRKALLAEKAS